MSPEALQSLLATASQVRVQLVKVIAISPDTGEGMERGLEFARILRWPQVLPDGLADEGGSSRALLPGAPIQFAGLALREVDLRALHGEPEHTS